jgi:hypothetical protein
MALVLAASLALPHQQPATLQLLDESGLEWTANHLRQRLRGVMDAYYDGNLLGYDRRFADALIDLLGPHGTQPASSAMDVGCGICLYAYDLRRGKTGPPSPTDSSSAAANGIPRVVGLEPFLPVDIRPAMIEFSTVDVIANEDLGGSFDAVINLEVAEHIPRENHTQVGRLHTRR